MMSRCSYAWEGWDQSRAAPQALKELMAPGDNVARAKENKLRLYSEPPRGSGAILLDSIVSGRLNFTVYNYMITRALEHSRVARGPAGGQLSW